MREKPVALADAVSAHIRDGAGVVLGASLESNIPFAATHEIIRQGKRRLNAIAPISDASTDMLIGAGLTIVDLTTEESDLEDIFLALTSRRAAQ